MVKVSVIVPVYNMEKYLDKCLNSLVNQTLKDIEIIVIDDGSIDNSSSIIANYVKRYPKIIKSFTQENSGISMARNKGIDLSTGKYLSFVDSDDYVHQEMLKDAYEYIKNTDSDIVVWDYDEVDEKGNSLKKCVIPSFTSTSLMDNSELLFNINPAPWNKLYKRELFDHIRFPNSRIKYEDLMTIPKLLISAKKISKLDRTYNYYLIRNNSETGVIDERVFDILKVLDNLNSFYKDKDVFGLRYEEIMYLNIKHILFQVLRQRNNKDYGIVNNFINNSYDFLNKTFPKWRKNLYYKTIENSKRRFITNNKLLIKLYCRIYYLLRGGKYNEEIKSS